MLNQKDGVFSAVCSVLESDSFDGAVNLTTEERAKVIAIVTAGLLNGEVSMTSEAREKHDGEAAMKKYTNGLVTNWINKDLRLNGGVKYEPKNPGSRAGSGDDVVKELRKLKSKFPSSSPEAEAIEVQIATRLEAIAKAKAKEVEINTDLIPESLKHLVG